MVLNKVYRCPCLLPMVSGVSSLFIHVLNLYVYTSSRYDWSVLSCELFKLPIHGPQFLDTPALHSVNLVLLSFLCV